MTHWTQIKHRAVSRIEKKVAEFKVWTTAGTPLAQFSVGVYQRGDRDFIATPSVGIRPDRQAPPDCIAGLGETVEQALDDCLTFFFREINDATRALDEDDFGDID